MAWSGHRTRLAIQRSVFKSRYVRNLQEYVKLKKGYNRNNPIIFISTLNLLFVEENLDNVNRVS